MTQRARRRQRRSRRKRSKILVGLGVVAGTVATAVLGFGFWVLSVAAEAPPIDELKPIDKGANSVIYAADGSRLGFIQSDESRTPVALKKIPKVMQEATIAIEDEDFYEHGGVDYDAIVRAAVKNIEAGKTLQGGSTITQQLVRNLYISDPERNLERKIREAKLAEELEERHPKSWILEQYLNSVSYGTVDGRTSVGVEAAAQTYFSKPASELTLNESALLAGLPQSPSLYNPFQNPNSAIERRNEVLAAMKRLGHISPNEAQTASKAPMGLQRGYRYTNVKEPYFFDFVEQQLIEEYGINSVRQGGLKIHTTIIPELQVAGREAIDSTLTYPDDPSSAVVTIDPENGHVLAMASSGSFEHEQYNLAAQGHRQPGSAFKPFVLTTAIRQGIDPDSTTYTSKPLNLELPDYGNWEVSTYGDSYLGPVSITKATLASDNTVYAQLDLDVGPENVRETAYDMGIKTKLDALPAEGLGGLRLGVSPLEMANAYATLAAGGMRNKPVAISKVEFPDGDSDEPQKPDRDKAFSDGIAHEVTKILKQNVQSGTGTRANIGCPSAGKTGTTDNFNDAWYVGYTPTMSTSVWVGYPDALREMTSVHGVSVAGGTFPAEIWNKYMSVAKGDECGDFPTPEDPADLQSHSSSYTGGSSAPSYDGGDGNYDTGGGTQGFGGGTGGYNPDNYAPGIQD